MASRPGAFIDGTSGRLGWSNRAQRLYRAILGIVATTLGVAALIWRPTVLAATFGAVLIVGGVSLVVVYARSRREVH